MMVLVGCGDGGGGGNVDTFFKLIFRQTFFLIFF